MKLNIFGVSHIASKNRMEEDTREFIEGKDIDAIFFERRDKDATGKQELKASIINPSLMLWKYFYKVIGHLMAGSKNLVFRRELNWESDDERIVQTLSEEKNLQVHRVDKSIEKSILDQGAAWMLWSWLIFGSIMFQMLQYSLSITPNTPLSSIAFGYGTILTGMFFTVNLLIALPFIISEIEPRNIYMIHNLKEISDKKGYEESLLITGRRHTEGQEKIAEIAGMEYDTSEYQRFYEQINRII